MALGLTADGEREPREECSSLARGIMELLIGEVPDRLNEAWWWWWLYGKSIFVSELGELMGLAISTKLP
jgi:hypothetical protein